MDSLLPYLRLSALSVFLDKLKVCCLVDLRQLLMFGAFYHCFSFFQVPGLYKNLAISLMIQKSSA